MSQQHAQFEEFHDGPQPKSAYYDGPQPTSSYQEGYSGPQPVSYTVNVPPAPAYMAVPAQRLVMPDMQGRGPSAGQRLALAIVSVVFTFVTFVVTLGIAAANAANFYPVVPIAVFFALFFAVFMLILNLIFNRRH